MTRLFAKALMTIALGVSTFVCVVAVEPEADERLPANQATGAPQADASPATTFVGKVILPMASSGATAVPRAQVTLWGSDGQSYRGVTNIHGEVIIRDVPAGGYAMTTHAQGVFACYGMDVFASDPLVEPEPAEIFCAMLTPARFESTVMPYLASTSPRRQVITATDDREMAKTHYEVLRSDGGLVGTLRGADGNSTGEMNVMIFQKRKPVARTISDAQGRFVIEDLPRGVYSLVAAGTDGVAAIGFELVDALAGNVNLNPTGDTFVNQMEAEDAGFDVEVVSLSVQEMEEVVGIEEEDDDEDTDDTDGDGSEGLADNDEPLLDEFGNPIEEMPLLDPYGSPLAGGGYAPGGGGSFGGGGGGGGGFGGGGGLAGAGILIGAAAAVVGSSDDNRFVPQVTSPVIPAN